MSAVLHLGDCLDFMRGLPDGAVDCVITDPPYPGLSGGITHMFGGVSDRVTPTETIGDLWHADLAPLAECRRIAKYGALVFCSYHSVADIPAIVGGKPIALIAWYKRNSQPSVRNRPHYMTEYIWAIEFNPGANWKVLKTYYDIPLLQAGCMATERICDNGGKAVHPTQKPVKLMRKLVQAFDGPVADPYMGTGTTGVASVLEGREFHGADNDPAYFAIAERRIREAEMQPALFQVGA